MTPRPFRCRFRMTIWSASRRPGNPSSGPPASSPPLLPAFFGRSLSCPKNVSILDRTASCLLPTFVPDRLRNAKPGEQISRNEQRVDLGEGDQRSGIAMTIATGKRRWSRCPWFRPGERSRCPGCSGARRTRSSKARFSQPYRVTRRRCYRTDREGRAHACLDLGQRLAQMHQQGVWFVPLQDQNRRNASDGFFFSSRTLVVCIAAAPKVLPGLRCSPRTVGTEELSAPEQNRPRSPTRLR